MVVQSHGRKSLRDVPNFRSLGKVFARVTAASERDREAKTNSMDRQQNVKETSAVKIVLVTEMQTIPILSGLCSFQ